MRGLGEIATRCVDCSAMVAFYRDVIGLEPMRDTEGASIAFSGLPLASKVTPPY